MSSYDEYADLTDFTYRDRKSQQYYIDNKKPVNILKIDRSEVRDYLSDNHFDWDELDVDMVIEYEDELREAGFDMNRIDDIKVVKEFHMENDLIFVQPGIEAHG